MRRPSPNEVTTLLAEARRIPRHDRVPMSVVPLGDDVAPVYMHRQHLLGPIATSMLITGAPGSLKSIAGVLTLTGIHLATRGQVALVLVNSKGNDFLFADQSRAIWSTKTDIPPLRQRDVTIYRALGFPEPPTLEQVTVFVPRATRPAWRSARTVEFPATQPYTLRYASAIRYACTPTDDGEQATSIITRQCIEEAAGPFAAQHGIMTLPALADRVEAELATMRTQRARWHHKYQRTTVVAAVRQLRTAARDLGPILAAAGAPPAFPAEHLRQGGTWVIEIAPLPQRAAQAVLDDLITALLEAKTTGIIPPHLPLVLLVDELNRWGAHGPTLAKVARIARDQRHRCFSVVGLAQQLSSLNKQLLASVDTFSFGNARSSEVTHEAYNYLPNHIRSQLHRLPQGQRVSRFEEALTIIRTLLREGRIDFEGTYYQAQECELRPRGPRSAGPPLLIGSVSPRMLRLAARHADQWNGWIPDRSRVEEVAPLRAKVDAACAGPAACGPCFVRRAVLIGDPVHRRAPPRLS